jgi:peptidylprolyl isomerase
MKKLISIVAVAAMLVFVASSLALAEEKADTSKAMTTLKDAEAAKAGTADAVKKDATKAKVTKVEKQDTVTTASGLKYIDIKVGNGATPKAGQTVEVHYTGWLMDGKKFDSSKDRNQPFTFPLGQGRVIKGWDEGLSTMKVGGVRKLIVPPALGYGPGGRPPVIPPNSVMVFEVELLGVK